MIVFDLACDSGHRFEGWFASSDAYEAQAHRGLVACPECQSDRIMKAPMAPAVPTKSNARAAVERRPVSADLPPNVAKALEALARAQADALKTSQWVGDAFADQSRAIHYGERDPAVIHGRATREEVASLVEEGVPVSPLPFPITPPDELN